MEERFVLKVLKALYHVYDVIIRAILRPVIKSNEQMIADIANRFDRQCNTNRKEMDALLLQVSTILNDNKQARSALQSRIDVMNGNLNQIIQSLDYIRDDIAAGLACVNSDSQLFNMCAQLYNERDWTRNAVYELRDETREESTLLQKLQEQDILLSESYRNEIHRHIDFTYRDLMIMLRGSNGNWGLEIDLETENPIAYESNDTIVPHGTIRDNTRCPRFVRRCEEIMGHSHALRFLDLGCSGGGMVLDALLRGHYGLGLEGSDASLQEQRAEWRLIPEHLKTCDIAKPFCIYQHGSHEPFLFDVVTAWEVLEHIPEESIPQLFANIYAALAPDGLFVATIAAKPDIDPETGVNWHVNIHPSDWWEKMLHDSGFSLENELFTVFDLARGVYNPPHCYEAPYDVSDANFEEDFYVVARKKRS